MAGTVCWTVSPTSLFLNRDDVHVWRASLDLHPPRVQALFRTLSADERARAERFRSRRDGKRFVVGRGLLRAVLARYLDVDPANLRFYYGPYGKPALTSSVGSHALRFNVSRADGLGLYVIARGREVGVDLERRQGHIEEGVVERFFSTREAARLWALPKYLRCEAFFACWTRKEAYAKARGEGLNLRFDQFDVSLAPGEPAALLHVEDDPREASRWSLQELNAGAGYTAALAVEGQGCRLACWQSWSPRERGTC